MDSRCSSAASWRGPGGGPVGGPIGGGARPGGGGARPGGGGARPGGGGASPGWAPADSYESTEKKCISDVRRTFCLFVTFDLLFVTMLWIIELNVNGGIQQQLEREVLQYDFHASFFDIFLLAVFRFAALILAYAVCKLRHWWAIAVTTAGCCAFLIVKVILSKLLSQGAFGYLLPIVSFVLAWLETWLLDFKVLPQEAEDETRFSSLMDAAERAPLMGPGPLSDGQFYSPPESLADSDEDLDDKHDPEKTLIQHLA
ncbi:STARD3 N-terminal-like protein [Menidia menidia]